MKIFNFYAIDLAGKPKSRSEAKYTENITKNNEARQLKL